MTRNSYINYQQIATQFKEGDMVSVPVHNIELGKVTAVITSTGFADVQTSYGNFRFPIEDLMKMDVDTSFFTDTYVDNSLHTWEREKSRKASSMFHRLATNYYNYRIRKVACKASEYREAGMSELEAYEFLFQTYSDRHSDDEIKKAVQIAYPKQGNSEARTSQSSSVNDKKALYWRSKGRRYVPTKKEVQEGVFHCPKCKTEMEKATYKKYTKLYACPDCLWLICPTEMLDQGENPPEEKEKKDLIDFFRPNDPVLRAIIGDGDDAE